MRMKLQNKVYVTKYFLKQPSRECSFSSANLLEELLSCQVLSVLLVLADDHDLAIVHVQRELALLVSHRLDRGLDSRVSDAVVPEGWCVLFFRYQFRINPFVGLYPNYMFNVQNVLLVGSLTFAGNGRGRRRGRARWPCCRGRRRGGPPRGCRRRS